MTKLGTTHDTETRASLWLSSMIWVYVIAHRVSLSPKYLFGMSGTGPSDITRHGENSEEFLGINLGTRCVVLRSQIRSADSQGRRITQTQAFSRSPTLMSTTLFRWLQSALLASSVPGHLQTFKGRHEDEARLLLSATCLSSVFLCPRTRLYVNADIARI